MEVSLKVIRKTWREPLVLDGECLVRTLTKTSWQVMRHGEVGGLYFLSRKAGDGSIESQSSKRGNGHREHQIPKSPDFL